MTQLSSLSLGGSQTAVVADSDTLYEVVNGEHVELPPMGVYEVWIASRLGYLLDSFVQPRRLGNVVGEMLFSLDPVKRLERRPDVAFVSYQRWPRHRPVPRTNAWEVVPELGVEVVSPSNSAEEIQTKLHDYFRTGVLLVWIIYPIQQLVYVYESPTRLRILTAADELDGGSVLPGFRMKIGDLFEEASEDTSAPSA